MGKPRGFLEIRRSKVSYRPVEERIHDYREFELPVPEPELKEQAARCMDCGIPFCHQGCPLGNLIPEWNDLVMAGRWDDAVASLHSTNNFPEVTGRVCPAPCEASCVLNITNTPVNIKLIEKSIAEHAIEREMLKPQIAPIRSGRRVAIVGSGPAGLACAQQLARKGHEVVVFEKADRIGGLLRYGIPDFKMEKEIIDRRVEQMEKEGVVFRTSTECGVDVTGEQLRRDFDAIVLCGGAMKPRDLEVPGRDAKGVHFAMDFLTQQNRRVAGDVIPENEAILATGRHVVVLGGGDTGSDCIGTSHRQGAASVTSLEIMPRPPDVRRPENPWPAWPLVYRTSSSHEEGGSREFGVLTRGIRCDEQGNIQALQVARSEVVVDPNTKAMRFEPVAGSDFEIPCDLLLLAMGFVGSSRDGLLAQLGVEMDKRGNVSVREGATNVPAVFAAGDMARGQSLVVWAIAEGRQVAEKVDAVLGRQGRQVA